MNAIAPPPLSIIGTFIAQLRTFAPIFNGRVGGAAEFNAGLRNYNTALPLPSAYVLPLGQDAEPNDGWGNLQQIVHKRIGIAVELDAQRDRRGQDPTMQFETIEAQLFASVLNLQIGQCRMARGSYFLGARYLDLDRARLFYQWEFGLDWQITDEDGVGQGGDPIEIDQLWILYWSAQQVPDPPVEPAIEQHLDLIDGSG